MTTTETQTTKPALERGGLQRGGAALVLSGALSGLLGLVYWVVAARLYGETAVGRNSSLISAMLTISGLAQLNYTRALSSLIPRAREKARRLVGRVYVGVGLASLAVGAILASILPGLSTRFAYLHPASLAIPGFALAVGLWSIFTLEDTVLASTRSAAIVPIENAFFGVAKLALLFLFVVVHVGGLSIFISWVLPLVVIVIPINIYAFRRALPRVANIVVTEVVVAGRWVRYDFAGYIFWLLGTSTLPFLVIAELGAKPAAAFYIPLTVSTAIDVISLNVGNVVTAEVSRNGGTVSRQTARFVVGFWLLVIVGSVTVAILAPTILTIFGRHYRNGSPEVLRFLLAAAAARSAMFLTNAMARAQGRGPRILLIQAVASVITLSVGLSTMSHIGTRGMATGWLIGSFLAGAISLRWFVPLLLRPALSRSHAPDPVVTPTDADPGVEPKPPPAKEGWWTGN